MSLKPETISFKNSLGFVKDPSAFIERSFLKQGDFYKLTLPFHNIFVVTDPEVLRQVLIRNESNYIKSRIYWGELHKMVGNALGTLEGEEWLGLKKLQKQAYTREKAETYLENALNNGLKHFSHWEQENKPLDIIHCFSELNVSTLLHNLFGYENAAANDLIASCIADGEEIISWRTKFPWRPYLAWLNGKNRRYKKHLVFFDGVTENVIKEQKQPKEALTKLIDILIENSEFGSQQGKITKEDIRNEIIIHLGAGTETAAVGIGWTLYLLSKHPDILDKMRKEIIVLAGGNPIKKENHKDLKYTEAVLKESLRMFPPSHGIIRDAVSEDTIRGVKIKKGDTMFISAYGLHRDPRLWQEPESFVPERFLNDEATAKYHYIPFGAGRHTCIGRFLALPMMVLNLASFVQNYNFKIQVKEPVLPLSLSTLKPNQPLLTTIKRSEN